MKMRENPHIVNTKYGISGQMQEYFWEIKAYFGQV